MGGQRSLGLYSDVEPTTGGLLPASIEKVWVPPIKCQGIKTKLVPFILSALRWDGEGRWVEPFLGSGVVAFNLLPKRALLADTNIPLITFYKAIQSGQVTSQDVRHHLQQEGDLLRRGGEDHYYFVRERFNRYGDSLDFLFLNRSCFNGVMRFNKKGDFNVPFCRKPDRFSAAYITRIVNQVSHLAQLLGPAKWTFLAADWRDTIDEVGPHDFIYADPPYEGRHTDYYSRWGPECTKELLNRLRASPVGFALSTWKRNLYRENSFLKATPEDVVVRTCKHFYHVGSHERFRNEMEEALLIRRGHEVPCGELLGP